nr:glycosyltransferase [Cryobacterium sp. M15]
MTRVLATGTADVLIVDDDSPDGTGALADQMAQANPAINVVHRSEIRLRRGLPA